MKSLGALILGWVWMVSVCAAPHFKVSTPEFHGHYEVNASALCATAKETLAYLNKGVAYDPVVIHSGTTAKISLERIKATLIFICQNQAHLNNPAFIKQHFDFVRWYPDVQRASQLARNKPLLKNLPQNRILMTKYFVPLAKASAKPTLNTPYALYALPNDEAHLTLEKANAQAALIRFKYGKQAVLKGALEQQAVPKLAYFSREDLESALMEGTVVADFGNGGKKIFNVHRNNNIPYDRTKPPYSQERYWYFKQVAGIKGYGKDAEYKITVNPEVTFAADLAQLGLGKILMVQYPNHSGALVTKMGILADTGGAFTDNLYQVDYLAGSYPGKEAFSQATRYLPDYVEAYFMVLKEKK